MISAYARDHCGLFARLAPWLWEECSGNDRGSEADRSLVAKTERDKAEERRNLGFKQRSGSALVAGEWTFSRGMWGEVRLPLYFSGDH